MKKSITILFLFAFTAHAQFKIAPDKLNHATCGFMIGYASNALTYHFTERKVLAFGVGLGMAVLAGHLKENYDLKHGSGYCVHDLHYASGGGFVGSITVSIITWKIIPKRKLPLEVQMRLDNENTMQRIKK